MEREVEAAPGGPIGVAQVNQILVRWLERAGTEAPDEYPTSSQRGLWWVVL